MLPDRTTAEKTIARSRAKDPKLARVTKITCGEYRVEGEHGQYTVRVSADGFACNCIAGSNGRCCWHASSVWRHRLAERSARPVNTKPARKTLEQLYDEQDARLAAAGVR